MEIITTNREIKINNSFESKRIEKIKRIKNERSIKILRNNVIKAEIEVINNKIGIMRIGNIDYISITDLAKYSNNDDPSGVIRNWMSNKNSFEYYGL